MLFYSSVLGLQPQAPARRSRHRVGLVRSQVVRSATGGCRLALNVAPLAWDVHRLPAARRLLQPTTSSPSPGGRVERGLRPLADPATTTTTTSIARFDLDPEPWSRRCAELGLLYDRDADGRLPHFYTATVGRVFFEVVQRRGGYDGYGAANAPVRLAAQHAEGG